MSFVPKKRLHKILCGVPTTPQTALEKAVKYFVDHAGSGEGGAGFLVATLTEDHDVWTSDVDENDILAAFEEKRPVFLKVGGVIVPVIMAFEEESDLAIAAGISSFYSNNDGTFAMYVLVTYDKSGWHIDVDHDELLIPDQTPLELEGVYDESGSKATMTFTETAEELYELCATGKRCKLSFTSLGGDTEAFCGINGIKIIDDDGQGNTTVTYIFTAETNAKFASSALSGSDVVVLTEV